MAKDKDEALTGPDSRKSVARQRRPSAIAMCSCSDRT
jgi:hypothetical protein